MAPDKPSTELTMLINWWAVKKINLKIKRSKEMEKMEEEE